MPVICAPGQRLSTSLLPCTLGWGRGHPSNTEWFTLLQENVNLEVYKSVVKCLMPPTQAGEGDVRLAGQTFVEAWGQMICNFTLALPWLFLGNCQLRSRSPVWIHPGTSCPNTTMNLEDFYLILGARFLNHGRPIGLKFTSAEPTRTSCF